jgi:arsenate reductase-like glutaredoxin family protein
LEARSVEITQTIPASRKLQRADAEELLSKATQMTVAKGKKVVVFDGGADATEAAVDAMLGSTGNLRAPAIVAGDTLLVGFNETTYADLFG